MNAERWTLELPVEQPCSGCGISFLADEQRTWRVKAPDVSVYHAACLPPWPPNGYRDGVLTMDLP